MGGSERGAGHCPQAPPQRQLSPPCNCSVDGAGLPRAPLLHGQSRLRPRGFPSLRPSPDGWVPGPAGFPLRAALRLWPQRTAHTLRPAARHSDAAEPADPAGLCTEAPCLSRTRGSPGAPCSPLPQPLPPPSELTPHQRLTTQPASAAGLGPFQVPGLRPRGVLPATALLIPAPLTAGTHCLSGPFVVYGTPPPTPRPGP